MTAKLRATVVMREIDLSQILTCVLVASTIGVLGILSACATPARPESMAPGPAGFQSHTLDSPYRNAITISKVGGGEKTNPLLVSKVGSEDLQEALRLSLLQYGFLSETDASAQFSLEVFLIELKQPSVGFTMTVDSAIRYKLIRNRDVQVVYDDIIIASYKATIDDAFYGPQRLQLASEGSIRANIALFLEQLNSIDAKE